MSVGLTTDQIVNRDARVCVCGQPPSWSRTRGGVVLACMNPECELFPAIKGPSVVDAIQYWNEAVTDRGKVRKRH